MNEHTYLTKEELEVGLDPIRQSPSDLGIIKMIVCRPEIEQRQVVETGLLDEQVGLVGDNWLQRVSAENSGRPADRDTQLTLMNARVVDLLARSPERWPLAGDQLFVDLDLSETNLPPGTRLGMGTAVIEITAKPHTGCAKFAQRFGLEALKFVNSPEGKRLHLRGIYARVVQPGVVRIGEPVRKL